MPKNVNCIQIIKVINSKWLATTIVKILWQKIIEIINLVSFNINKNNTNLYMHLILNDDKKYIIHSFIIWIIWILDLTKYQGGDFRDMKNIQGGVEIKIKCPALLLYFIHNILNVVVNNPHKLYIFPIQYIILKFYQ